MAILERNAAGNFVADCLARKRCRPFQIDDAVDAAALRVHFQIAARTERIASGRIGRKKRRDGAAIGSRNQTQMAPGGIAKLNAREPQRLAGTAFGNRKRIAVHLQIARDLCGAGGQHDANRDQ